MKDLKHSMPPWEVFPIKEQLTFDKGIMITGYRVYTSDKRLLHESRFSFDFEKEEKEANAKLIAAAPELLEALILCSSQITNHESGHCKQFQEAFKIAQEAIKKATS